MKFQSRLKFVAMVGLMAAISLLSSCEPADENPDLLRGTSKKRDNLKKVINKATEGDPESQFILGFKYAFGDGVTKNIKEGVRWLRVASENDHPKAQLCMAIILSFGFEDNEMLVDHRLKDSMSDFERKFKGTDEEVAEEAAKWIYKAVAHGCKEAEYILGTMYRRDKMPYSYILAAGYESYIEDIINEIDAAAMNRDNKPEKWILDDWKEAHVRVRVSMGIIPYEWYSLAANKGYAPAQFEMGFNYADGITVEQDYSKAIEYWRSAAYQDHAKSQFILALLYDEGKHVQKDSQLALMWYDMAIRNFNKIDYLCEDGVVFQIINVLRQRAEEDNWKAKTELDSLLNVGGFGYMFLDDYRILSHFDRLDRAYSQFSMGLMFETGDGAPQNLKEAIRWYTMAAEQGDADAQNKLGVMYAQGKGVPQDYKEAVAWFSRAAEQGYASAQYNLGLMYANGQGVPTDYVLSYKWFNLAAAEGNENAIHNRDRIRTQMSPDQIAEAQRLSREFKPTN